MTTKTIQGLGATGKLNRVALPAEDVVKLLEAVISPDNPLGRKSVNISVQDPTAIPVIIGVARDVFGVTLDFQFEPPGSIAELERHNSRTSFTVTAHVLDPTERLRLFGQTPLSIRSERAKHFREWILPLLVHSAAMSTGIGAKTTLSKHLNKVLSPKKMSTEGLGLRQGKPNVDYGAFAASQVAVPILQELGFSEDHIEFAIQCMKQSAMSFTKSDTKYGPTVEDMRLQNPSTLRVFERVTRFIKDGGQVSEGERALAVVMSIENLGWHAVNYQRAADQPDRTDPDARKFAFRDLRHNLKSQKTNRAAVEMVLLDAANGVTGADPKSRFSISPSEEFPREESEYEEP